MSRNEGVGQPAGEGENEMRAVMQLAESVLRVGAKSNRMQPRQAGLVRATRLRHSPVIAGLPIVSKRKETALGVL